MEVGWLQTALITVSVLGLTVWRWAYSNKQRARLPPGSPGLPIIGNILEIKDGPLAFEKFVSKCKDKYGGIFTIWVGHAPLIVITDRHLAHEALIKQSATFAHRPKPTGFFKTFSSDGHTISTSVGPLWRTLRGNLVTATLSRSVIAEFSSTRAWAIAKLLEDLAEEAKTNDGVVEPRAKFSDLLYRIVLTMCFGFSPDDSSMREVKGIMSEMKSTLFLDDSPISPLIPWKRKRVMRIRSALFKALLPLIHASKSPSYVSGLQELRIHEEGRPLTDDEMVTLCVDILIAATDSTYPVLEWCLARLALHQHMQETLYKEINEIPTQGSSPMVTEEDVKGMKYLQAVVKETLRIHPPGHFVAPHAVSEDAELGGYRIPAGTKVNFYTYGMAMDPLVWDKPDEFRPERFLEENTEVDMTGTKEIFLMPFSAGRRICPGIGLAMMHLPLFIARLVQCFKWEVVPGGEGINLAAEVGLITVIQRPLRALVTLRHGSLCT